ncbi:MAG: hypothetical protein KAJ03_03095, partial [Gammaproteobacteria bacterium]|nr:hypothetical protein [Gammaproteobacteria bacterium]
MSSKINNCLLRLIMFCVVGIYSAPVWTGNNQVDAAPADSEQAVIEQDHNLLTETEALVKDIEAKSKEAREKFVIVKKSTGEKRSLAGTQVLDIENEIRKLLDTLIANIKTLENQDFDVSSYFKAAKKLTAKQSKSIIEEIKYVKVRMESIKGKRDKTEAGEMFLLETKVTQGRSITDQLLKALLENTERMKLVDLDATKDLDYLKKELQDLVIITSTRLEIYTNKINDLKRGIENAGEEQSFDLAGELNALEERKAGLVSSLRSTIKLM